MRSLGGDAIPDIAATHRRTALNRRYPASASTQSDETSGEKTTTLASATASATTAESTASANTLTRESPPTTRATCAPRSPSAITNQEPSAVGWPADIRRTGH